MSTVAIYTAFRWARGWEHQLVSSVLGQICSDWRWYVSFEMNREPKDGNLVRKAAADDERIIIREQDEPTDLIGLAKARALACVQDEKWAIHLDSDDWLEPESVGEVMARETTDAPMMVAWQLSHRYGRPPFLVEAQIPLTVENILAQPWMADFWRAYNVHSVRAVGGYDRSLFVAEDWDLDCRLAQQWGPPLVIPYPLGHKTERGMDRDPARQADCVARVMKKNELREYK